MRRTEMPLDGGLRLLRRGDVHSLDGVQHPVSQTLLLELLDERAIDPLVADVAARLRRAVPGWRGHEVVVFDELVQVYGAAAQRWSGCVVEPARTMWVSRELAAIVEGYGGDSNAYARGWVARVRCMRWAAAQVSSARVGDPAPPAGSVLARLAATELSDRAAAVELVNVLRPTTAAVARLGTFVALHLATSPDRRRVLDSDTGPAHYWFAQEVRRTTPFGQHGPPGEPLTVRILAETARELSTVELVPIRTRVVDPRRTATQSPTGLRMGVA